jgi:hypothetical protein
MHVPCTAAPCLTAPPVAQEQVQSNQQQITSFIEASIAVHQRAAGDIPPGPEHARAALQSRVSLTVPPVAQEQVQSHQQQTTTGVMTR